MESLDGVPVCSYEIKKPGSNVGDGKIISESQGMECNALLSIYLTIVGKPRISVLFTKSLQRFLNCCVL